MRRTLVALLTAMLAGLLLSADAASAQDAPIPRTYPSTGFARTGNWLPPEDAARDTALADGHEAECNRGAMAGCLMLGIAFETGRGRPQSRPVAELLYREACTGGLADSCARLGKLLRSVDAGDTRAISAGLFVQACRAGSAAGCEAEADDLAAGVTGPPDPAGAKALLRATCEGGSASTCNRLARRLIMFGNSEAERAEGLALHDRQCRARQAADCRDAMRYWNQVEGSISTRTREYLSLGCAADDARACADRGRHAMRNGIGPEARAAGLAFYERACELAPVHCEAASVIRDEVAMVQACASGDNPACDRLVTAYGEDGGPLEDLPQAAALLGWMCDSATADDAVSKTCAAAGERALALAAKRSDVADYPVDPARIEAHLTRACTAGSDDACSRLAKALADGAVLPLDVPRALALYETRCDAGDDDACDRLAYAIATEASAPLMMARADDFPPPEYSPEEIAAQMREYNELVEKIRQNQDENSCITTEVEFRGQRYTDTICMSVTAVINAFNVKTGTAPWQALIWRPKRLDRFNLSEADRVLCGGAVIRTGWVLTAAHCLTDASKKLGFSVPIISGGHRIRLGVYNPLEPEGLSYRILRVIQHPDFKPKNFAFDIALIQYDPKGEKLGDVVHPVARIRVDPQPMAGRTIVARMPAYTFGWGRTAYEGGSEPPTALRGARLELRDMENCTRVTGFRDDMRGAVLCASGARGEQTCFGDSGGPLITYADADKVPTVIGVVSAGVKCGSTAVPSRFTRIAHPRVQVWLDSILPPPARR